MRTVGMGVAAAVLASCVHLPEPELPDSTGESEHHAERWMEAWEEARAEHAPTVHQRRAELAYEALTSEFGKAWALMRRGVRFHALASQGRRELRLAVLAAPNDPRSFALLALWESRLERNPNTAVQAACHAARLSPQAEYLELCGDALREAGEPEQAVARWKAALQLAEEARWFSLLVKIDRVAGGDFVGIRPELVRQYRSWKITRGQGGGAFR